MGSQRGTIFFLGGGEAAIMKGVNEVFFCAALLPVKKSAIGL